MSKRSWPWEPSWSPVGPHGARVRVIQRGPGVEARLVFTARDGYGYDEEPLGFGVFNEDGKLAEGRVEAAKREAAKFSNLRLSGEVAADEEPEPLTLGELVDVARAHLDSVLEGAESDERERRFRRRLTALEHFFGRDFVVEDLAPHDLARYHSARKRGVIDCRGQRVPEGKRTGVSATTVSGDLQALRQICRFATRFRGEEGRLLLEADPTRDYELKRNKDPRRPIVTDELLEGLRKAAPKVTAQLKRATKEREAVVGPTPLPVLIEVANGTGRRIGSIVRLRWEDWAPERRFEGWSVPGALTFRGENDKAGKTWTVPVLPEVREALVEWRAEQPDILPDEAWMFPRPTDPERPVRVDEAIKWLQEAEKAVRGEHVPYFGFHAFRRRWTNRVARRLPPAIAAEMGGWKGPQVMQSVYERTPNPGGMAAELGRAFGGSAEEKSEKAEAGG